MCPYQFYDNKEVYYPRLYCKIKENTMTPYCLYSKRCEKEGRYIALDNVECDIMKNEQKRMIPKGSYFVKTTKVRPDGTFSLYVEIDGAIEKINTSFKNFDLNYIYLDYKDGVYIPSLSPISRKRKKKKNES